MTVFVDFWNSLGWIIPVFGLLGLLFSLALHDILAPFLEV